MTDGSVNGAEVEKGSGKPPVLDMRNVTKIFGGGLFSRRQTVAVDDVSFTIPSNAPGITAVAGESGSGKTTLARLLLGIIPPDKGDILYLGKNIRAMNDDEQRSFRREVQPIFQDPFEVYNPFYKVDHILTTPVRNFRLSNDAKGDKDLILSALETVGLRPQETLGRFPHQLSGGQRQRLMVARALLLKPRVIVADEPVSMVDASLRATILKSIRLVNKDLGISVIYITHDLTTAFQITDNIIVMYQGTVVEAGSVDDVIGNPKHPYTRLLVESIPQPNPKLKWEGSMALHETGMDAETKGCNFAPRCPYVMDECRTNKPPLIKTEDTRAASCWLYKDASKGNVQAVDEVFTGSS